MVGQVEEGTTDVRPDAKVAVQDSVFFKEVWRGQIRMSPLMLLWPLFDHQSLSVGKALHQTCQRNTEAVDKVPRLFFFFFLQEHAGVPGPGLCHSCNLRHSCDNAGSLTH